MQQIVNFITKYKYFLFFLLLEFIAFSFTIQSHSYHKSKFVNSANTVTGGLYNRINSYREFRNLRVFNEQLQQENIELKNLLAKQKLEGKSFAFSDSSEYKQRYSYTPAKIINNQYHKKYNHLLLDKGSKSNIKSDQGVVNSKGIIGITQTVSKNYATVLSILNENAKINVKLKNRLHFGTLQWNGEDYNILQLIDMPIQANIKEGDTLVTGGKSVIFPEGIPVGTVKNFGVQNNNYTFINIQLFNDMSAIGPVNIITNLDRNEIDSIQKVTLDEY